jgi:hypothetical protein
MCGVQSNVLTQVRSFWTLCAMCFEIFNFYFSGKEGPVRTHAEKPPHPETGRAPADAPADVAQPAA